MFIHIPDTIILNQNASAPTHLEPSLTLLALVTTVMGDDSSPTLTEHILSGFFPPTLLSSMNRTIPTLY